MSKGKYVKRTFPLAGLHCAGCAARVEKILNAQTGVVAASVNLAASTAAVEYDTMQTSPERLRQAVQEGGYDMLADSDDDTPDELERMNRERYRDLKRRAFWAVVLAIPVVVIGMFFMSGSSILFSILGIVIFSCYTAYDTQKIKAAYFAYAGNPELAKKASVFSALELYLDFINLFLYILRIFSRSRD